MPSSPKDRVEFLAAQPDVGEVNLWVPNPRGASKGRYGAASRQEIWVRTARWRWAWPGWYEDFASASRMDCLPGSNPAPRHLGARSSSPSAMNSPRSSAGSATARLHGLQQMHGSRLHVPRQEELRPRREFLEERYALFRKAG